MNGSARRSIQALNAFEKTMIIPMMGFVFALIAIGGLASLLVAADAKHAILATYIGPILLFAGLGAFFLSLGLLGICEQVAPLRVLSGFSFCGGYAAGGIGGAALGFRRALSIRRRIDAEAHQ
jgi:hypothetical protein